ncbi:MAG: hypothetical protein M1814_000484 [Vezdaea aestivalis]|nr:MAG: hypothetical protein M1814_000484 [Vezdaea aestivalis]
MPNCHDLLQLFRERSEWFLLYSPRFRGVVEGLTRASDQFPAVFLFAGQRRKTSAIPAVFPNIRPAKSRGRSLASLHLDSSTVTEEFPTLLIDFNVDSDVLKGWSDPRGRPNGHSSVYRIDWSDEGKEFTSRDVSAALCARVLLPFASVLCIFAEESGGLEGVKSMLIELTDRSTTPPRQHVKQSLVIVAYEPCDSSWYDAAAALRVLCPALTSNFESIRSVVVAKPSRRRFSSSKNRHRELRDALAEGASVARGASRQSRMLLSAAHTCALFERSLEYAVVEGALPGPVRLARIGNELDDDFSAHLAHFLGLIIDKPSAPNDFIHRFVASAIVMDAYPPKMHMFDPVAVFSELYRTPCLDAFSRYFDLTTAEGHCRSTQSLVASLFFLIEVGACSSSELRRDTLGADIAHLGALKSTGSCLWCLRRKPEHVLQCGHAICDVCVRIFGVPASGLEYQFHIRLCILCASAVEVGVRLLPPTVGPTLLSVDGGGTRGVIALEFLEAVERELGLPYPLQDQVDMAFGTSSGALIVLGLFSKCWSVKACASLFDRLARRIFPRPANFCRSISSRIGKILASFLADGHYDAPTLEIALKETFGRRRLFDISDNGRSGTKISVTATTVSDTTLCLFSNYNGIGRRRSDAGYRQIRPRSAAEEPYVWEAFFAPKRLPALGTYQDGGLKANNPTEPALCESHIVWPANGEPNVLLSVGTGYDNRLQSNTELAVWNILRDGFIARLFRASMALLSGQNAWRDLWNRLREDVRSDYFRLNLPLGRSEPSLDDVEAMDDLRVQAARHVAAEDDSRAGSGIAEVVEALLTASFFFELDDEGFGFVGRSCNGSILCRSPHPRALVRRILDSYPDARFVSEKGSYVAALSESDICARCGSYGKGIQLETGQSSGKLSLCLLFNKSRRRRVGGFPNSIAWFAHRQKLNAPFGRSEHKPLREGCGCKPEERRQGARKRLWVESEHAETRQKRRRG